MQITLPHEIDFACPGCKAQFTLRREYLHQRSSLYCPICGVSFAVFSGLTGKLRRRVYQAVRGYLEGRVYEQQQMDQETYFEDSANL